MSDWIRLHDSEWTPESITAEIANRASKRETGLGPLEIDVPPFSYRKGAPEPPQDRPYNAALYNHLSLLNERPPLDVAPLLEDSAAAGTALLGGLRRRIRQQLHGLVLFYVNRAAAQQQGVNDGLTAALNELMRAIEAQQQIPHSEFRIPNSKRKT